MWNCDFAVLVATLLFVRHLIFDLDSTGTCFDHLLGEKVGCFLITKAGINVEDLADGAEDAASDEEVAAALASIDDADVAGIAAAEAAKATKEAGANISQEDLARAAFNGPLGKLSLIHI